MDTEQVLKVGISAINLWTGWQFFYAKMGKDGRITLPKLQRELLRDREQNLTGYVMEVTLEPVMILYLGTREFLESYATTIFHLLN